MNSSLSRCVPLLLACVSSVALVTAQQAADPWYALQARPQNFNPPTVFKDTFTIQLPKNWQLAPGFTGTLFSLVEKSRGSEPSALIMLQYNQLQAPLDPALMDGASDFMLKDVQSRELAGKQFARQVKTGPAGPFVMIHYDRPGFYGRSDRVILYGFPVGTTMYRLICIASAADIEKYRPIFAHVAASFRPLQASGS